MNAGIVARALVTTLLVASPCVYGQEPAAPAAGETYQQQMAREQR